MLPRFRVLWFVGHRGFTIEKLGKYLFQGLPLPAYFFSPLFD